MSAMKNNIRISKETKDILGAIKAKEGHSSYDSVIRSLIERIVLTKRINQPKERKK